MAKYTLLEMVQTILSSMDSDEVTSITDTVESQQVVKVIKTAYYDLIDRASLPENFSLINLTETDANTPVIMTFPETVSEIQWVKYDNSTTTDTDVNMQLVTHLPLDVFMDRMDSLSESLSEVSTFNYTTNGGTFLIKYWNDRFPQYYATLDDNTLLFDAFNGEDVADTYLLGSKTRAYAKLAVQWNEVDGFTFTLDEPQYSLFLNEAKSLAWAELKMSPHLKAEQYAKRGWTHVQKHKFNTENVVDFDNLPYFGRK